MYFQDVILTLERYWGSKGCVLLQPHDLMMGAGTFHPATVLRTLGPGRWNCAFVQPSRRPGDARYGDNPNRLGHYYQYQVILKPSPVDVLEQYVGSLEALGIDLRRNDLRFVEDDWESPTLGAWGLGWEVWLNGMEVTQFTYFQQVGGRTILPVPAEITYGLERLTMQLQGKQSIFDIEWVQGVTYRDVFHRNEVEQSRYNFEHSDVAALLDEFNRNFAECERLAKQHRLALPAFDRCIMSSHSFNLLNARGAISVAERANYVRRIRELACLCAEVWDEEVASREPAVPQPPAPVAIPVTDPRPTGTRELFVEITCEELPARMIDGAREALRDRVVEVLAGIEHGPVRAWSSPRHLAVAVADVAPARPTVKRLVTGPPADKALGPDGTPTPVGLGFAKGKGAPPSALVVVDGPKGKVVALEVSEGGEAVTDLVAEALDRIVRGLPFPKTMEWAHGGVRWARPVHHVNATYDGVRIPGVAAGRPIGADTVGHRLAADTRFSFTGSADWLEGLRARGVEPDPAARTERIRGLLALATERIGCDPIVDDELLAEVVNLVEAPTLVIGTFDPVLLALPSRLLVQTMKQNQRYFPVFRDGKLHNDFVVISNNPWGDADAVAKGNAAVILARFDDARFFLAEDRKRRLEEHGGKLSGMRWIKGLGTMADKQARVGALGVRLAELAGAEVEVVRRAGELCRADLVTQMVGEFPDLQGHVGALYARGQGEPEAVAVAIEESWFPRSAEDEVPRTPAGVALALADRLDTLVACFGVGIVPKSSGDPQGLRRAATGLVRILVEHGLRTDLRALFRDVVDATHAAVLAAPEGFEAWTKARGTGSSPKDGDALVDELVTFVLARFSAAQDTTADVVEAVLAVTPPDPVVLQKKVDALRALAGHGEFGEILVTFKRVLNITRGVDFPAPDPSELTHDAERRLQKATRAVAAEVADLVGRLEFGRALDRVLVLREPIGALFDAVMVDSPDPRELAVRKGLLLEVARCFLAVADFSRISSR